ncbi:type II secretion system minor pseudopilin GspK [Marinobacter koreensis]|uniref:Type II secretion system protein K n=1 Tax=Marinobacter koreensis TaxID=335974 RepID=A0ABW0RG14_9GAMM|nr:type II secretion system minor pseudopilin GspK [Marinobacter koreensis]MCK7548357.1 type II secretion system minor pseudopilin GspK [Marinobacter koreensis]
MSRLVRGERGVALIMVLLALALVVMLAAGMTRQLNIRVFKAGHYLAQQQGYSIALGAEAFARRILTRDFEDDKDDNAMVDSLDEVWASNSAILPLDENGVVEVQIDDLGGRFNLNDLVTASGQVDTLAKDRFSRLLQALGINGISADTLVDWIDANDQTISAYGAEDGQYLMADPGYRAANQPFTSVTELRLVQGMTEEIYQALKPYVAAVPVSGVGINVNTASGPVLQSLHEKLSESDIQSVLKKREEQPFENVQDFLALPEFAGLGLTAAELTVQTRFFEVVSRITYDNRVVTMVSTVFRNGEGKVRTISRDTGQKNRITKEPYTISEG